LEFANKDAAKQTINTNAFGNEHKCTWYIHAHLDSPGFLITAGTNMANAKLAYIEIDNPELLVSLGNKPDIVNIQNILTGREYDQTAMWGGLLPYYSWRRNAANIAVGEYDKVSLTTVHYNI
jgi:hypothetical protein